MKQKAFLLRNSRGVSVEALSTGAAIRRIVVPDANGRFQNVVLGFENAASYSGNPLFAGAALGPVAGRISGARVSISGVEYPLTKNDGENNLHGGAHSISFAEWEEVHAEPHCLELQTFLPDGTDGFPGNRRFTAAYRLDEENRLTLTYTAVSDRDTYLNLSNHTYLNLSGDFSKSALAQRLSIRAEQYIINDESHLPAALASVERSPYDFRAPAAPADYIRASHALPDYGYNNGFALAPGGGPAASLSDPGSGRRVRLYTDAPCLVFYSGGYIPDDLALLSGGSSSAGCALALEAQDFPDALNCPFLPAAITKAGEIYTRTITYQFDAI